MTRRENLLRVTCGEKGCGEHALYRYPTITEYREASRRFAVEPYHCVRHTAPDRVLGLERLEIETTLEAQALLTPRSETLFWTGQGVRSGFSFGPGFKAFADDFPPGTKLIITARVVLPDDD